MTRLRARISYVLLNSRLLPWNWRWVARWARSEQRAALDALDRCYGVPYLKELSSREHHGMLQLERRGLVDRDEGFTGLHWHLTEAGRRWARRHDKEVCA